MDFLGKLGVIREKMRGNGVGAVVLPSADPHQSPSVSAHWKTVQRLTGFSGSLAICIISADAAALWTDGRYLLQAQRELEGKDVEIYISSDPDAPDYTQWICGHIKDGETAVVDKSLISAAEYNSVSQKLALKNIKIDDYDDYVGEFWKERPPISREPLFELADAYAGVSRKAKAESVRAKMREKQADCYIASSLDAVAWLTNLRGGDNPIYPLFHSYLLFTEENIWLCAELSKVGADIAEKLKSDGFRLCGLNDIFALAAVETVGKRVYLDRYKTSARLCDSLPQKSSVVEGIDLITSIKSKKSEAERENIRLSNIKECVALCRLIKYIKENVGKSAMDEYGIGQKVNEFRAMDPLFMRPANVPIVAVSENAALPHYKPRQGASRAIEPNGFLLFDLCAHYYTGSTDITRTIQIGPLSDEMRRDYTNVLKAHISLATLVFPFGTTGFVIDGIVKSHQWRRRMNYDTGTGHGIGYCLDIHEGPCKIVSEFSPLFPYAMTVPLDVGMLFSNEPGVYKKGRFGVRLENNIMVREDCVNEFGRFLKFETLTYCPFERGAIVKEMLTEEELEWLNAYHRKTYVILSPCLNAEEKAWLKNETAEM